MPFPTNPLRRRETSCAANEVDRHGNPLESEPLSHLVLHPVGVVARYEALVVDEDPEARRPFMNLRRVQQIQTLAILGGRLPSVAQLGEEVVELGRRHLGDITVEELGNRIEQAIETAARLRRDSNERWAL